MDQLTSTWQEIGALDDFIEGEPAAVVAGQKPIAVFRLGDEVFALHDLCTHGMARLSEGFVEDGCVECPLHQGLFDIRTGAPQCAPVTEAVRSYPIRVVDGRVEIHVD
ncbi:anthranilate 1,2-dioxygenase ferredoxin subunit AndAb [Caballeronia sp. Lep1P3]|uniref:anthranilate 1,2-dioxygenase ferredoxin subunit AndAb n=1 Tax=Caballeronia sp. Lep1P3 TaxID=2878150 RepID=UPI001FD162F7|nr:anthranilate 1,2-dioxygenase ferredoxin subunit AndAb [Caballeronia sp. Lep1P3]